MAKHRTEIQQVTSVQDIITCLGASSVTCDHSRPRHEGDVLVQQDVITRPGISSASKIFARGWLYYKTLHRIRTTVGGETEMMTARPTSKEAPQDIFISEHILVATMAENRKSIETALMLSIHPSHVRFSKYRRH